MCEQFARVKTTRRPPNKQQRRQQQKARRRHGDGDDDENALTFNEPHRDSGDRDDAVVVARCKRAGEKADAEASQVTTATQATNLLLNTRLTANRKTKSDSNFASG